MIVGRKCFARSNYPTVNTVFCDVKTWTYREHFAAVPARRVGTGFTRVLTVAASHHPLLRALLVVVLRIVLRTSAAQRRECADRQRLAIRARAVCKRLVLFEIDVGSVAGHGLLRRAKRISFQRLSRPAAASARPPVPTSCDSASVPLLSVSLRREQQIGLSDLHRRAAADLPRRQVATVLGEQHLAFRFERLVNTAGANERLLAFVELLLPVVLRILQPLHQYLGASEVRHQVLVVKHNVLSAHKLARNLHVVGGPLLFRIRTVQAAEVAVWELTDRAQQQWNLVRRARKQRGMALNRRGSTALAARLLFARARLELLEPERVVVVCGEYG